MLIDPSWEVEADKTIPRHMANIRKWNVGILILWYPILKGGLHGPMLKALETAFPEGLRHEVRFPRPAKGTGWRGPACSSSTRPMGWPRKPPG